MDNENSKLYDNDKTVFVCIGNSMVSSAIWKKHARVSFSKTILKSLENSRVYVFSNCTRNHTITYYTTKYMETDVLPGLLPETS